MDPIQRITGRTRLLGVIGWPIDHSMSPAMQAAAIAAASLDLAYVALPVAPGRLPQALAGLPALGFLGANVTIPHKEAVARMMGELTPEARAVGAVNTIKVGEDGSLLGHNTDVGGLVEALRTELGCCLRGRHVTIVGCGGAGRAAAFAAAGEGAASLVLANRDPGRAEALAGDLRLAFPQLPMETTPSPPNGEALRRSGVVLQMTSLGMRDGDPLALDPGLLAAGSILLDAVIRPGFTELVRRARAIGLPAADGRSMLVAQGALAFEFWTGRTADRAAMRAALDSML